MIVFVRLTYILFHTHYCLFILKPCFCPIAHALTNSRKLTNIIIKSLRNLQVTHHDDQQSASERTYHNINLWSHIIKLLLLFSPVFSFIYCRVMPKNRIIQLLITDLVSTHHEKIRVKSRIACAKCKCICMVLMQT